MDFKIINLIYHFILNDILAHTFQLFHLLQPKLVGKKKNSKGAKINVMDEMN